MTPFRDQFNIRVDKKILGINFSYSEKEERNIPYPS
jgi:hypothetical protein